MTDRLQGVVVTFDRDIRDDDAQALLGAIGQIKHVINVEPVITDVRDHMARARIQSEIQTVLWKALDEYNRNTS